MSIISSWFYGVTKELGLAPPSYSQAIEDEAFKQVDSERIDLVLGYTFTQNLD